MNHEKSPRPGIAARRNVLFKILGDLASRGFTLLLFLYLARRLGAEDLGLYQYGFSLLFIWGLLADCGLRTLAVLYASRDRIGSLRHLLTLNLATSAVAMVLMASLVLATEQSTGTRLFLLLASVLMAAGAVGDLLCGMLVGRQRVDLESLVKGVDKSLSLLLGGLAIYEGLGLVGVAAALLVARSVSVLLAGILLRTTVLPSRISVSSPVQPRYREILGQAFPLALSGVFAAVYVRIDILMLRWLRVDPAALGSYAAAVKLLDLTSLVPFLLMAGLFPVLARLHAQEDGKLKRFFPVAAKLMLWLGLPVAIGLLALRVPLVSWFYGEGYDQAPAALGILSLTVPFIYLTYLGFQLLLVIGRLRVQAMVTGAGVVINVVLNLLLIPRLGIQGSAIATVVTEIALVAFLLKAWRGEGWRLPGIGEALRLLLAMLPAAILFPLAGRVPVAVLIVGAPLLWAAVVLYGRCWSRYEVEMMALERFWRAAGGRLREAAARGPGR